MAAEYTDSVSMLARMEADNKDSSAIQNMIAQRKKEVEQNDVVNSLKMSGYDANNKRHNKVLSSLYYEDKIALIKEGYALELFVYDENAAVREAVAEQGYGLDILMHDNNGSVEWAAISYPAKIILP